MAREREITRELLHAGREAWLATRLRDATTTAEFVSAFEALANAMPDLGSWLPDWDNEGADLRCSETAR